MWSTPSAIRNIIFLIGLSAFAIMNYNIIIIFIWLITIISRLLNLGSIDLCSILFSIDLITWQSAMLEIGCYCSASFIIDGE